MILYFVAEAFLADLAPLGERKIVFFFSRDAGMDEKIRVVSLQNMKNEARKIVMVTAYDYPTGRLADEAGVDVVLVGDSLGQTVLGHETTIPVTLDVMAHHAAAVRRGVRRAFLAVDMPFLTYKVNAEDALRNAGHLVQEGGAEAVKVEGGREVAPIVRRIVEAGIPVMGHLGLLPQSVHALGGYRVQGREEGALPRLLEDARELEEAGCFSIVLECLPWEAAEKVTASVRVPTIGIGAGAGCDGQVLVLSDLLGLSFMKPARFVKQYARLGRQIKKAIGSFAREVREGSYPGREHRYNADRMDDMDKMDEAEKMDN